MSPRLYAMAPYALAVLLATMLMGAQFGFTWAGGAGHVPPARVSIQAVTDPVRVEHAGSTRTLARSVMPVRGEIIRVGTGGYAALDIGGTGTIVSLDSETNLELVSLSPENIQIRLLQGRMAVAPHPDMGTVTIYAGPAHLTVQKTGWLSVVHTESQGTVSVAPMGTVVGAILPGTSATVSASPFDYVYWWTPPGTQNTVFNPTIGDHAAFYERFLKAAGLGAR